MGEEITINVGDSFAGKYNQFSELLGDQFESRMRNLVEDEIHTVTQQIERQTEQEQAQLEQDNVDEFADE